MQTATDDLLIGRTLDGRYRIIDRIARGGMSTVYSALDERLDRLVAVKVMNSGLSADPAFTDRFAREARAAARLTNPNTVAVYDQGVDDGPGGHHVFLVMELVRGRTLRGVIREHPGPFGPAAALSIMAPILSALSAAHAAGIVHRDVKPENILVSDAGGVKVADFGLARAIESDAAATRTGLMMGTVAYCAPEQITRGRTDQRSDVYATGILLFELLTGDPPFRGDSPINVAYQHVNSRVPAPSSRVRGVPSEIDELVILATDPDPAERPADAAAFLALLAEVRETLGLPTVPIPSRRHGDAAGGATAPVADLAGGRLSTPGVDSAATDVLGPRFTRERGVTTASGHREIPSYGHGRDHDTAREPSAAAPPPTVTPPRRRRASPSPRRRRRRRGPIVVLVVVLLGIGGGYWAWWYAAGRYARVPDVVGQSRTVAEQVLHDTGFALGGTAGSKYSETVSAGDVIATKPAARSKHVSGTKVALVISLGPLRIDVPDVRTMTPDAARAKIIGDRLHVNSTVRYKHNIKIAKGRVVNTLPNPGTPVRKDTSVTLYVSLGPPKVTVPDVAGKPYQDAARALSDAKFKPVRGPDVYSDTVDKGDVVKASPTGSVTEFSTITITVSKGPQLVDVPQIKRGSSTDQAEQALTALHLNVVTKPFFRFAGDGHVWAVYPSPGTPVRLGSTVTITTY